MKLLSDENARALLEAAEDQWELIRMNGGTDFRKPATIRALRKAIVTVAGKFDREPSGDMGAVPGEEEYAVH